MITYSWQKYKKNDISGNNSGLKEKETPFTPTLRDSIA
jgi:hypothetical protein